MPLWSVLLCVWVRVHSGDRTLVLSFQFCFPRMSSHVIKCQLTGQSHIHFVPSLIAHTWKLSHSSLAVSLNVCPLLRPWASVEWRLLSICSVVSESLWPHGLQHTRLPCASQTPGACSNSGPLSQWWPFNRLILCRSLLLLPSIFPSIRVFSNESAICIRWPKYWSFSFSISPSNEYSGLISFRMDWLDLLVVQGPLKSLLKDNSKALILQHSGFFIIQL